MSGLTKKQRELLSHCAIKWAVSKLTVHERNLLAYCCGRWVVVKGAAERFTMKREDVVRVKEGK